MEAEGALAMDGIKRNNLKKGRNVAFISVIVSFLLVVMKGGVGLLCNSQVLVADAIHSGADLMTHAASGFGLWIAGRKKTDTFPFGLYRAETIACLLVGVLICLAGVDLFKDGYHKLFHLEQVNGFPLFPIGASIISSIAAFAMATMESKVGRAIGSKSLMASAKEAYMDIFTSLAVLIGIVLAYYQVPYAEGVIIILIAVLLLKIGIENGWSALLILMDANLEPELQQNITLEIRQIKGVESVDDVKIRQSGPFKMVECIIATRAELSLYRAHNVADKVEQMIAENFEHIESIFVHVEPGKKESLLAVIPVDDDGGLVATIHNHFARAPYHLVVKLREGQSQVISCHENIHLQSKEHIGVKASRQVVEYGADLLLTSSIGEISFHIIHSNMIEIYRAEGGTTVQQALHAYFAGKLEQMCEPAHLFEESQVHQQMYSPPALVGDS